MMDRVAERDLATKFGTFREMLYRDGNAESSALVLGEIAGEEEILCRIHSACIGGHVFNSVECECADEMAAAQAAIQRAGRGVIVYLDQEGKGNGHLALMKSIPFKKAGHSQSEAYELAGFAADARNFRPAAEILAELNVRSVVLLTSNPKKVEDLNGFSIKITRTMQLPKF